MNARQRKNLLKLATYLETLPADYAHFDMDSYAAHKGDCDLALEPDQFAATRPQEFLANCGTVACAVGHGPAAGFLLRPAELATLGGSVRWYKYADRVFGADTIVGDTQVFNFLFDGDWANSDNHHYGAAARIRYFLDTGRVFDPWDAAARGAYAPYRKGSRSAKRREIDAASCDTHPKDGDVKQAPLGSGAVGEAETPNA